MPQSLSAVYIHLVFSTKHRHPSLRDESLRKDLRSFLGGTSKTLECPNLEQVKSYIANQEDHHRTLSFQDEVRALLTKHQIDWDERYIWE